MIVKQIELEGSGKGTSGWFPVKQANVSFDHPFNVVLEHALNIDFVNEAQGPGARVAVEMSVESARALVQTITEVLQRAELGGIWRSFTRKVPTTKQLQERQYINPIQTLYE